MMMMMMLTMKRERKDIWTSGFGWKEFNDLQGILHKGKKPNARKIRLTCLLPHAMPPKGVKKAKADPNEFLSQRRIFKRTRVAVVFCSPAFSNNQPNNE
jgi:hypothetical protein